MDAPQTNPITFATSGPQTNFTTASTTAVDVTGATVTISPSATAKVQAIISGRAFPATGSDIIRVSLWIDGAKIQEFDVTNGANLGVGFALSGQATVSSGSRVIKMQGYNATAARNVNIDQANVNVMYG